jgi:predicted site-specific integrase-resolvase
MSPFCRNGFDSAMLYQKTVAILRNLLAYNQLIGPFCRVIIGRSDATDHSMTNTDTPKLNVGYARVSTDKQDNGNQLEQLRFAATQGWAIAVEYVDTVTGSGRKVRPQFERMLLAASQRKFDLLLFWALDRLSREGIVRTLGYLEQLRAWNIGWRRYTQPFLDT